MSPETAPPSEPDPVTATAAACVSFLALDHGDWAEENMNACELTAGHEPPHRQRFPAQHGVPAYVVEWADEAWWDDDTPTD